MQITQIKIVDKTALGNFNFPITRFFVPPTINRVLLRASGFGGDGGANNGTRGAGGGGASGFIDQYIDVQPGSLITVASVLSNTGIQIGYVDLAGIAQALNIWHGFAGQDASGTNPGNGGDSGNGGIGGTNGTETQRRPTGFVDGDGLIHSTGGWAGTGSASTTTNLINDLACSALVGAKIQDYKTKFSFGLKFDVSLGGAGGCSYWGPGGVDGTSVSPNGYGAGAAGSALRTPGGPAFVSISFDWPDI